jgi:hypothetical protein
MSDKAYLKITQRVPTGNPKYIVTNDQIAVVDAEGNVLADISHLVSGYEFITTVGEARRLRIHMFATADLFAVEVVDGEQPT